MSSFDYGNKKENGQYERYPTNLDGELVAPIRNKYVHDTCGVLTQCGDKIAETYARNPGYYSRTFCIACRDHFPVQEFKWDGTNIRVGKIDEAQPELEATE